MSPRTNPYEVHRKLRPGSLGGDRAVQPGVHTVILPGPPAPAVSPPPILLGGVGPDGMFGDSAPNSINLDATDPSSGWPYAWEFQARGDGVACNPGSWSHPHVTGWSEIASVAASGSGSERFRLGLSIATGGSVGSGTIVHTNGAGASYLGIGGRMGMFSSQFGYYGAAPRVPADLFFADVLTPSDATTLDCSSVHDSATFWCYIKFELLRSSGYDTPLHIATGSGSGAAPTINPVETEPSAMLWILMCVGYEIGTCVTPAAPPAPTVLDQSYDHPIGDGMEAGPLFTNHVYCNAIITTVHADLPA